MKKLLSLLIFLIFIFPIISSIDFNISSEFQRGETLTAKLSGNFVEPILKENIHFYRGHVRVSIEPFVAKINDEFYIYSALPETSGNYSIEISGAKYKSGSQIIEGNITKEFSISNATADFSISPGFVISDTAFFLEVQNLQDSQITIKIEQETISGDEEDFSVADEVSLKSGEVKKISFTLENLIEPTFKIVGLNTENTKYGIPINMFDIDKSFKKDNENVIDLDEIEDEEIINEGDSEVVLPEDYIAETSETCAMLEGVLLGKNQECVGGKNSTKYADDGVCCLDGTQDIVTSSTGKIIAWAIVVAVLGFLFWFFRFKYRGAKGEINLLKIGKKK